jgi:hypothetical protein
VCQWRHPSWHAKENLAANIIFAGSRFVFLFFGQEVKGLNLWFSSHHTNRSTYPPSPDECWRRVSLEWDGAQLYISLDKQPSHIQFRLEGVGNYINWINIFTAQTHKTRAHLSTLNSIQPTWFSLVNLYNNVDQGAYPATFTILNFEWLTCQSLNCIRSKHNNNYYYWPTPAAAAVMPELRNEFGGARSDRWAPLTHSVIQRAYYKTFLLSYFGNPNIRYTHTHTHTLEPSEGGSAANGQNIQQTKDLRCFTQPNESRSRVSFQKN